MRNVSDKSSGENQHTHYVFNTFFPPENRAFYGVMSKNMVEPGRPRMKI